MQTEVVDEIIEHLTMHTHKLKLNKASLCSQQLGIACLWLCEPRDDVKSILSKKAGLLTIINSLLLILLGKGAGLACTQCKEKQKQGMLEGKFHSIALQRLIRILNLPVLKLPSWNCVDGMHSPGVQPFLIYQQLSLQFSTYMFSYSLYSQPWFWCPVKSEFITCVRPWNIQS